MTALPVGMHLVHAQLVSSNKTKICYFVEKKKGMKWLLSTCSKTKYLIKGNCVKHEFVKSFKLKDQELLANSMCCTG